MRPHLFGVSLFDLCLHTASLFDLRIIKSKLHYNYSHYPHNPTTKYFLNFVVHEGIPIQGV
jgi:hypothetical protein